MKLIEEYKAIKGYNNKYYSYARIKSLYRVIIKG